MHSSKVGRQLRTLFIIIFIWVNGHVSYGQNTNKKQIGPFKFVGDLSCVYKPKYSATQRSQLYPFNIADTIKLVSFRYHRHNYPIKGDTLLVDSLLEVKTLKNVQINQITDILYNNFYKKKPNYGFVTQCFFPRNAILFVDKDGKLKEYILICFHCNRHEESSDKVIFGDDCSEKVEKLRQFFVLMGLNFGTDKKIMFYPGENTGFGINY